MEVQDVHVCMGFRMLSFGTYSNPGKSVHVFECFLPYLLLSFTSFRPSLPFFIPSLPSPIAFPFLH